MNCFAPHSLSFEENHLSTIIHNTVNFEHLQLDTRINYKSAFSQLFCVAAPVFPSHASLLSLQTMRFTSWHATNEIPQNLKHQVDPRYFRSNTLFKTTPTTSSPDEFICRHKAMFTSTLSIVMNKPSIPTGCRNIYLFCSLLSLLKCTTSARHGVNA